MIGPPPATSTERRVPTQAVLFEVARVCEGCPSPGALLNPLDQYEQVAGARAIAMYLLHHPKVGNLSFAEIAQLFSYERKEVERYCELVEEASAEQVKFASFLERMITRLRVQAGLEQPAARAPAALRSALVSSSAQAEALAKWIEKSEAKEGPHTIADLFGGQENEPEQRPAGQNGQRRWAWGTIAHQANARRDAEIVRAYQSGTAVPALATQHAVTGEAIYRVLRQAKAVRPRGSQTRSASAALLRPADVASESPQVTVRPASGGMVSVRLAVPKVTHYPDGMVSVRIKVP